MYLNKAMVYGNLTRDPEMRSLPSGQTVTNFSLATNRTWKDQNGAKQESTDYHNIVVFGRQAENVNQYLKKGNSAFVEGRMQTRSWEQDGQKRYRTEIVADNVQFGPKGGGGGFSQQAEGDAAAEPAPAQTGKGDTIDYPEDEINPDDIPF
ncbi:single-stranded DNA-binding protein [Patescibacteria group bacterium]|jgi:single-strand DNA-binding protein|nr:single-stranded DNA-binding protein [Patescibacteria group bacterium]